ncbi:uncharacterized protein IWZ02DRAFT_435293 [Phyllosticta citriasiana]|uniref:uncharacterized protein n=1 Tax=Phyllosticta citriasiana TaxID=595635 RepID=UPI0030FDD61A
MTPPATAPSISVQDTSQNRRTVHPAGASPTTGTGTGTASARNPHQTQHRHLPRSRRRSPGPEWRTAWDPKEWHNGRVLLIDYVGSEQSGNGKRKIIAQEFHRIEDLRAFCSNKPLRDQSLLRVIHCQNATWAMHYLLRKYNMVHEDDLIGTAFGHWARFEKPQQRAGKPVLNGRTFRPQRDPWRGISRCAFGLDYLRHYGSRKFNKCAADESVKFMELNWYDADENPAIGCDVFVQRLSVYVQKNEGSPIDAEELDMRDPYNEGEYQEYIRLQRRMNGRQARRRHNDYFPRPNELDNRNTIIIFEQAQSRSPEDTLIQARNEIESRWRRLPFYLKKEQQATDQQLAVECMDFVLKDVFKALSMSWENFLRGCETHVSILEDKIYDNPADESRAPELWLNSSLWLKVEKLIYLHLDIAKETRMMMKELTADEGVDEWLSSIPEDFDKLATSVQEDLIKPTGNLSDMMYKSVEIRDARQGLRMDASMWRLSWITFIFLPMTFLVSFFGMNVDTFDSNPSIKWYFISLVPLSIFVFCILFAFKRASSMSDKSGPSAVQRGAYEHLFHEFADQFPRLWSPNGPRQNIHPRGSFFHGLKWRLVKSWYDPDRTIHAKAYNPAEDLGKMARLKRDFTRRWLKELNASPLSLDVPRLQDQASAAERGESDLESGDNRNSTHSNGSSGFHTGHTTAISNGNVSTRPKPNRGTAVANNGNLSISSNNVHRQARTSFSPPQPNNPRSTASSLATSEMNDFPSPGPDPESGFVYGGDSDNYPFPYPTCHPPFCSAPNPFTPAFGPLTALLGPGPAHEVHGAGVAGMSVVGGAVGSPAVATAVFEEQERSNSVRGRSRSRSQRGRLSPVEEAAWRGAVVGAVPGVGLGYTTRLDDNARAPDEGHMVEEVEVDKDDDDGETNATAGAERPRPRTRPPYWPATPPPSPSPPSPGPPPRAATSPTLSALRNVMVAEEETNSSGAESGSDVDRSRSTPPPPPPPPPSQSPRPRPRTSSSARLSVPGVYDVDGQLERDGQVEEDGEDNSRRRSMQIGGGW